MQNNIKQDLWQELNKLLTEYTALDINPAATMRDYARLRDRIYVIDSMLADLEKPS